METSPRRRRKDVRDDVGEEVRLSVVGDEVDVRAVGDHALVDGVEGPCEDDEGFEIPVVAGI